MKTKLTFVKKEAPQIDWTKQNLLKYEGTYVLSTGRKGADDDLFEAVIIHDSDGVFKVGRISNQFLKTLWELVTDEVTITFTFNAK